VEKLGPFKRLTVEVKTLPYDWRVLLIMAVVFLALYAVLSYLLLRYFTAPQLGEYVASYLYAHGANLV